MAGERTLPGLGLTGYWDPGSDGWAAGMDENLRLLSAVVQLNVASLTAAIPASPAQGDRIIAPAGDANEGQIGLYDNGAWVWVPPVEGWLAYIADEGAHYRFESGAWAPLATSGGESGGGGSGGGGERMNLPLLQDEIDADHSTTAFATKGAEFRTFDSITIAGMGARVDSSDQTFQLLLVSLGYPSSVVEVLEQSGDLSPGWGEKVLMHDFAAPRTLPPGQYAVLAVLKETDTAPCPAYVSSFTSTTYSGRIFMSGLVPTLRVTGVQVASAAPGVGTSLSGNNTPLAAYLRKDL